MNNVIPFPCKARRAANDPNPWLGSPPVESPRMPRQIRKSIVVDSGVEHVYYVDEKPQRPSAGSFLLGVLAWLFLFALVL